jgi:hypothetical protein
MAENHQSNSEHNCGGYGQHIRGYQHRGRGLQNNRRGRVRGSDIKDYSYTPGISCWYHQTDSHSAKGCFYLKQKTQESAEAEGITK